MPGGLGVTPRFHLSPPGRVLSNGECRVAEPLCRETEGVPQIQLLSLPARACPELAEGTWAMG